MAILKPIHYQSNHPINQKLGTLTSAVLKARKLTTEQVDLWSELNFVRRAYLEQGYPIDKIHSTIFKALQKELWPFNNNTHLNIYGFIFRQNSVAFVLPQNLYP